jgi:hypothetical protein
MADHDPALCAALDPAPASEVRDDEGCRPGCKPGGACRWIGCKNSPGIADDEGDA